MAKIGYKNGYIRPKCPFCLTIVCFFPVMNGHQRSVKTGWRILPEQEAYIYIYIYIYVSYFDWRGLLFFIIFNTHMVCISRWKFIKTKKREKWCMPIKNFVLLFWNDSQKMTFPLTLITPEIRLLLVAYLGSYDSFSDLVLRKVPISRFLGKPNYKNPRRFLSFWKCKIFINSKV